MKINETKNPSPTTQDIAQIINNYKTNFGETKSQ